MPTTESCSVATLPSGARPSIEIRSCATLRWKDGGSHNSYDFVLNPRILDPGCKSPAHERLCWCPIPPAEGRVIRRSGATSAGCPPATTDRLEWGTRRHWCRERVMGDRVRCRTPTIHVLVLLYPPDSPDSSDSTVRSIRYEVDPRTVVLAKVAFHERPFGSAATEPRRSRQLLPLMNPFGP